MTLHCYRSLAITFGRIMGLFWVLFGVLLLLILPMAWYDFFTGFPTAIPIDGLLVFTFSSLFGIVLGVTVSNFFPDIMIHGGGLSVKFYFKWLFVPWEDVISVKPLPIRKRRTYLVRVKKLTVVHRLISLCQWGSLQPGFLISSNIDGYHDLLRVIREHIDET